MGSPCWSGLGSHREQRCPFSSFHLSCLFSCPPRPRTREAGSSPLLLKWLNLGRVIWCFTTPILTPPMSGQQQTPVAECLWYKPKPTSWWCHGHVDYEMAVSGPRHPRTNCGPTGLEYNWDSLQGGKIWDGRSLVFRIRSLGPDKN